MNLANKEVMERDFEQTVSELQSLNQVTEIFSTVRDVSLIAGMSNRIILGHVQMDDGVLFLKSDSSDLFEKTTSSKKSKLTNLLPQKFQIDDELLKSFVNSESVSVFDRDSIVLKRFDTDNSVLNQLITFPIQANDELYGFVVLGQTENTPVELNKKIIEFCQTLIRLMATSIINIRLHNQIEGQNLNLKQIVDEKTRSLKYLLDNTGQRFFLFGKNYIILPESSKSCADFFNTNVIGKNALELLFEDSSSSTYRDAKEMLDLVFNETASMAIAEDLLPKEIQLNDYFLKAEYKFIKAEAENEEIDAEDGIDLFSEKKEVPVNNSHENQILILLSDITKEKQLALAMQQQTEKNERFLRVARDREGFIQTLRDIHNLFLGIYSNLASKAEDISTNALLRALHSIKGSAATYNLNVLATAIHEIEEIVLRLAEESKRIVDEDSVEILNLSIRAQGF